MSANSYAISLKEKEQDIQLKKDGDSFVRNSIKNELDERMKYLNDEN